MATLTEEERDAKVDAKQQETEQKEAEKKEQKEAEKSEHEDKYFVVHGGTCVCNKAEDPTKEAEIVVTKNTQLVINEDAKKFAATEEDTTMKPPAATFGKCTLKPSSSGNLPCAPAFLPKWEKAYDKKTVQGKKILTELSTLQCTIGGKIEIKKHGQEDSVVKEHAENTDEAEQALINPAVPLPLLKPEFPSVSSVDLKEITGRTNFVAVKSSGSGVEKISIRLNEEVTFNANLKKGNTRLTSWVIYQLNGSKVGEKLITSEQIGTTFKNTFPTLGNYRVEGYGQPKIGEKDKNWPDCSIDVEVILNKLNGTSLQPKEGDSFTRKNSKSENKLRKGFLATFEAKFLLEPNEEEIQNLNIYATDGSGNVITSGTQSGNTFSFTPPNSDGKYTINATYTNPEGKIETQTFTATTESAFVGGISHGVEIVRPETPMTFKVTNTQFKAGSLGSDEASAVKWNLNGQLIGKGSTITIPGNNFLKEGKYVVEAYVNSANATGANAKNEEDDWHFEVKKNDVVSFGYVGQPKVGKTTQLKADKFLMPPIAGEKVVWNVFGKVLENSKNTNPVIDITPGSARKENITCKINNQKGVTKSITIVEAEIVNAHFTDNNSIKIENASWDQKVNILIEQKHLIGEEINIEVFDHDYMSGNDSVYTKNIKKYDGKLVSFKLDKAIKEKTGTWGKLFFKVTAPHLTLKNADKNYPAKDLNVKDGITFTNAIIGEENGLKQHAIVDYDKVSWFYANTTGIKAGTKLKVGVWEAVLGRDDFKLSLKPTIDEDGVLKAKIDWKNIPKIKEPRRVYIQVKDENDTVLFDSDGGVASKTDPSSKKSGFKGAATSLVFVAAAVYMVDNMAAVVVGTQALAPTDEHQCPNCNKPITLDDIENLFGVYSKHRAFRQEVVDNLNQYIFNSGKEIHVNTCLRKAHFFAQVGAETLGINPDWMVETDSVRYTVSNCIAVFGNRAQNLKNNNLLSTYCSDNPQTRLLNYVYANENGFGNGNGNEASGDGYLFRGRGLKQLTGRGNYKDASVTLKSIFPNEYIDLEANPDIVKEPKYAVLSALAFWEKHSIWLTADSIKESTDENIKTIRRKVNPGLAGWRESKNYFEKGIGVFKVKDCKPDVVDSNQGSAVWQNPLKNPQITIHTFGGHARPWRSAFGRVRTDMTGSDNGARPHHGLDLFAAIGTDLFACLPGEVVSVNPGTGYGNGFVFKIDDNYLEEFKKQRRSYSPYYVKSKRTYDSSVYAISGYGDFAEYEGISESTSVYLMYAHLSEVLVTLNEKITESNMNKVVGKTGTSGATGTKGPHLHFEIRSKQSPSGYTDRYNPAYYINYKNEEQLTISERTVQNVAAGK